MRNGNHDKAPQSLILEAQAQLWLEKIGLVPPPMRTWENFRHRHQQQPTLIWNKDLKIVGAARSENKTFSQHCLDLDLIFSHSGSTGFFYFISGLSRTIKSLDLNLMLLFFY